MNRPRITTPPRRGTAIAGSAADRGARPRAGPPPAPRTPDANAIELFARVVAAGSFAQAARELSQTRAAVSARIAALEAQLGAPLFARTTRALGLTEAGRRLAQHARAVLDAADAARRGLRRQRRGLGGTLRLTAVPLVGTALLAPLLARFQADHPELKIELRLTYRAVDLLREDVDVAFRLTARPPEDWVAEPLLPFIVRAYAAPGPQWPLAKPEDLAGQRCLVFGAPTALQTLAWQRGRRSVPVAIDPALVGDDLGTLVAVARAGGGIVFCPDFGVAAEVAAGQLVDVLPGWRLPVSQGDAIVALTLPVPAAPESARALVRFIRESLGAAAIER